MKVLLLRHGMTAGNASRRYIGCTDEPLSPQGIAAARAMGTTPSLPLVYVTPLLRTQQTAHILFPNAEQYVVEDLREMNFGIFEGKSADELSCDQAYQDWVAGNCMGRCPAGESVGEFADRVQAAFKRTVTSHSISASDTAVFIVHGGTIMAVMQKFARPVRGFYDSSVKNCHGFLCAVSFQPEDKHLPFVLTNVTEVDRAERITG